jgi:hypothetical protein
MDWSRRGLLKKPAIHLLTVRRTRFLCCPTQFKVTANICNEPSMFMLFCYVKCSLRQRKIYGASDIGSLTKFKKSFPAKLLSTPPA